MRSVVLFTVLATTLGLVAPAGAEMADACFEDCRAMEAEREALFETANSAAAISGGLTREIDALDGAIAACYERCSALEGLQRDFEDCIERARTGAEQYDLTEEELEIEMEHCRSAYLDGKDAFNKRY